MKKITSLFLAVVMLFSMMAGLNLTALADDDTETTIIEVTGTYCQTEARTILDMVNEMRTGDDAWYYNEDGSVYTCSDLSELTYDYTLEQAAMQRAAEIAIYTSHTRPSGQTCFTVYSEYGLTYVAAGENIASGQTSATEAFTAWSEEDENYDGQGHRRNMLGNSFASIGIACFYYHGTYYWAMELCGTKDEINTNPTTANDGETTVNVTVPADESTWTKFNYGDYLRHFFLGKKTTLPTCTTEGIMTWTCTTCGYTYTTSIAATGHSYESTVVDPTCTKQGYTKYTCSSCGDVYYEDYTDALGHSYDEGVVTTEPACETEGVKTYTCSVCGDKYTESIDALGHSYVQTEVIEPTCTEQGYTIYTCTGCGDVYYDNYTDALGHTVVTDEAVAPACDTTGLTAGLHCSVCGEVLTAQETIAVLGHTWDNGVITKDATCTENGIKTYTCTECGKTYTETIKATGHSYTDVAEDDGLSFHQACTECGTTTASTTCTVKLSKTSITYTGTVQRPTVTVTDSTGKSLVYKTDFTVDYSNWNSTNVGTYTVTVKFLGDYSVLGSKNYTYKITALSSVTPVLSRTTITMNGTVQRPTVTVTDKYGNKLTYNKDFTVSYSNWSSKAVGRYTVTVTMMGNYSGTKTYAYYINPKSTTITSVTGASKSFTVKWNKQTNSTTGYQIQYATKSDFSNAATIYAGASSATSKTVTGRASKTKYYVRIRTYKNIGGKYFYSDWSSVKTVTTK